MHTYHRGARRGRHYNVIKIAKSFERGTKQVCASFYFNGRATCQ
jgi:hypothetical protein